MSQPQQPQPPCLHLISYNHKEAVEALEKATKALEKAKQQSQLRHLIYYDHEFCSSSLGKGK